MSVFRYRDLLFLFFWRLWWAVFCDLSFSKFHHFTLLKGIMVTNRLRIKGQLSDRKHNLYSNSSCIQFLKRFIKS